MIKLLSNLQAHCAAIDDMFHTEACHFATPRETLAAVFGAENCHYRRTGEFFVLTLVPSQLKYSLRATPGTTRNQHFATLARRALHSLPPMRLASILERKLLYNDKSLCANPFSLRSAGGANDERDIETLAQCGDKRAASECDCRGTTPSTRSAMQLLAERAQCSETEIAFDFFSITVEEKVLIRCIVRTPTRSFEPYVYCETMKSAQKHGVLAALLQIK